MTGADRSPPLWLPIAAGAVGVVGAALCFAWWVAWTGNVPW